LTTWQSLQIFFTEALIFINLFLNPLSNLTRGRLSSPVDNPSLFFVVRAHLHRHLITRQYFDPIHSQFPRQMAQGFSSIGQPDAEIGIGQGLENLSLISQYIFIRHVNNLRCQSFHHSLPMGTVAGQFPSAFSAENLLVKRLDNLLIYQINCNSSTASPEDTLLPRFSRKSSYSKRTDKSIFSRSFGIEVLQKGETLISTRLTFGWFIKKNLASFIFFSASAFLRSVSLTGR
jgi:hypothetical protein